MAKKSQVEKGKGIAVPAESIRADLIRGAILALLAVLIWCAVYNRWTGESWQTPLTYRSEPEKADAMSLFAAVKAASQGHFLPFFFTNIPELGAPFTANWDDFPTTEKPLICLTGLLASLIGVFAAVNFAVMLGHVLAALAFYTACRLLNANWTWAFAGALIFGFARYAFAHALHHLTILYYWHVPLCVLVGYWAISGEGIKWDGRRFYIALAVAFITGVQNVYYTNLFAQFVLFGGLLQGWRRGWRAAVPAGAVIGTAAVAFLVMNLNTIFYHMAHGGNDQAVTRNYQWLEIYGLKIVDMVVPPPDHPVSFLASWGAAHLKEVVLAPGELPPSGYLGIVGLAACAWLVVISLRQAIGREKLPLETYFILWILIYAGVGGLNGIMGTLGFQLFRATTRYTIFILCIVLMYAVGYLSAKVSRDKMLIYIASVVLTALALWDQMPPIVSSEELATTAQSVASDRHFTEEMEKRLPPNAMVFQMPVMDFPETPAPGVSPYDHFRPYLFSQHLRYSFGSDKGRPQQHWQESVKQMQQLNDLVTRLEGYGFAAIYVNRGGFTDKAEPMIDMFKKMGRGDIIESEQHDIYCVLLKPAAQPTLPDAN